MAMKQRLAAILVADVAGYSLLMGTDERATVTALNARRRVFRDVSAGHAGRVVDTAGDSVLAIFDSATGAINAAILVQEQLARLNDELPADRRMLFRIGINLGDVIEQEDGTIYGDGVNVAARIQSMAEPGGVYLSGSTYDSVRSKVPASFEFLGEHQMKHIAHPVRAFRIIDSDSKPALSQPASVVGSGNLPHPTTRFIGRTKERRTISTVLERERCVTLIGVGGSGKTRLSLEVAAEIAKNFSNGAWVCELAPVAVAEGVEHALASALRVEQRSGLSMRETLLEILKGRSQLLVMDNCEHLLEEAAATVSAILRHCPGVKILTTSREPLAIDGESVIPILPLDVPGVESSNTLGKVSKTDSVRLFVDRATAVQSEFAITDSNFGAIAEICRRLDGVPLAIELAAARVRSLTLPDILNRLNERFRLLTGGRRDAVARHQTLRATIDWSYGLLSENEKTLFCKLSVFVGGFYLEAAEVVCSSEANNTDDVLDILTSLSDKSMVLIERTQEGNRYRLLESFRQYGNELIDGASNEVLLRAHCQYFVEYAERGEPNIRGPSEREWVDRFDAEFDNFRAAFAYAQKSGDLDLSLRLCACLPLYGIFRLRFEPNTWAAKAADMDGAAQHPRASYVAGYAAWGAWITGNFSLAKSYGLRALEWEGQFGSKRTWLPRHALMCLCFNEGNMTEALRLTNEQIAISQSSSDSVRVAHLLMAKSAYLSSLAGEDQLELARESERLARQGGNPAAISLGCYAMAVALATSAPMKSLAYIEECLAIAKPIRYGWIIATALTFQCALLAQHGTPRDELKSVSEAISVWYRAGDWSSQWRTMRFAIPPLASAGAFVEASTLLGIVSKKTFMGDFPAGFEERISSSLDTCIKELGPESFEVARHHGTELTDEKSIAFTLDAVGRTLAQGL